MPRLTGKTLLPALGVGGICTLDEKERDIPTRGLSDEPSSSANSSSFPGKTARKLTRNGIHHFPHTTILQVAC